MDDVFAVQVFPIAKPAEWREFLQSAESGERAEAHRSALRRLGVKREHVHHQSTPAGDIMVLVWEGVRQEDIEGLMGDMIQNPQSEHEKYLATHVIPNLHGVDPTAGPPPPVKKVATIDVS
jgi:hypothetical protein